jgi:hypothetical protein
MRAQVLLLSCLAIGSTAGHAASLPAYIAAIESFEAEAKKMGLDPGFEAPVCDDFFPSEAAVGPLTSKGCQAQGKCAKVGVAGFNEMPNRYLLNVHTQAPDCTDDLIRKLRSIFETTFLECSTATGRAAAVEQLMRNPIRLDDPTTRRRIGPIRNDEAPEATDVGKACRTMSGRRRLYTVDKVQNEDILLYKLLK